MDLADSMHWCARRRVEEEGQIDVVMRAGGVSAFRTPVCKPRGDVEFPQR